MVCKRNPNLCHGFISCSPLITKKSEVEGNFEIKIEGDKATKWRKKKPRCRRSHFKRVQRSSVRCAIVQYKDSNPAISVPEPVQDQSATLSKKTHQLLADPANALFQEPKVWNAFSGAHLHDRLRRRFHRQRRQRRRRRQLGRRQVLNRRVFSSSSYRQSYQALPDAGPVVLRPPNTGLGKVSCKHTTRVSRG